MLWNDAVRKGMSVALANPNERCASLLIETTKESPYLLFNRVIQAIGHNQPNVFLLVFLSHWDMSTAWFQLDRLCFAELNLLSGEIVLSMISSLQFVRRIKDSHRRCQ